tara:strand:+ start:137 stop:670 length:534 start_codon:yes stop_codon:yes gene_type:complete
MIIECKSCNKKFIIPDSAIGPSGRLVQCSSCGNKWKQTPVVKNSENLILNDKKTQQTQINKKIKKDKNITKFKKRKKTETYSREYLEKKHGIKIINPSLSVSSKKNNKKKTNISSVGLGFYNSLLIFVIFLITFFGVLDLTKDLIVINFPYLESYVNYIFEAVDIMKTLFLDISKIY